MRHPAIAIAVVLTLWLPAAMTMATGTPAGTTITNQATATYNVGPTTFVELSNLTTTAVAELLDVTVTWQDAAPITVSPGDTAEATTFLVTNTGNGSEEFALAGLSTLPGDDFDPTLNDLYFDSNGNGLYDSGVDAQYVPGSNDPILVADSSIIVFLVNNIPATTLEGELGNSQLTATASTGSGAPGTVFAGLGDGGVDAVSGSSGSSGTMSGTYVVSTVIISIVKTVNIVDPFGGVEPVPGATMTYSLVISATGSGTGVGVVITDAIPTNTTYVAGTLELNSSSLTDGTDGDVGDVGATTAGEVTVALGDLVALSPIQTITFAVTID